MWTRWVRKDKHLEQLVDDQDLLSDVEVYSPDGRCGGVQVADLPSPRC